MDIPGKKILIPVEVQAQAQQVIVEMKKMIDEMDAKVSKFQSMGFVGMAGAANQQNFLKKAGVIGVNESIKEQENIEQKVKSGAGFEDTLNRAVDDSVQEIIDKEISTGGKLANAQKFLGVTGFNKETFENLKDLALNPKMIAMKVAKAMPYAAIALIAYEVGKLLYDKLTSRNGLFDLTFRRHVEEEFIKLRARELRQQIRVGERQAIFVSEAGVSHPIETINTLELVRNGDIFNLDTFRVRKGYQF